MTKFFFQHLKKYIFFINSANTPVVPLLRLLLVELAEGVVAHSTQPQVRPTATAPHGHAKLRTALLVGGVPRVFVILQGGFEQAGHCKPYTKNDILIQN